MVVYVQIKAEISWRDIPDHGFQKGQLIVFGLNNPIPFLFAFLFYAFSVRAVQPDHALPQDGVFVFFIQGEDRRHVVALEKNMSQSGILQKFKIGRTEVIGVSGFNAVIQSGRAVLDKGTEFFQEGIQARHLLFIQIFELKNQGADFILHGRQKVQEGIKNFMG